MAIQHDTEAGPSSPRDAAISQPMNGPETVSGGLKESATNDGVTTCDACRSRKVRCLPLPESDIEQARAEGKGGFCKGCYRRKEDCAFQYRYKKPGRPKGATNRYRRESSGQSHSHRSSTSIPSPVTTARPPPEVHPFHRHSYTSQNDHPTNTMSPPALSDSRSRPYLEASSYASAAAAQQYGPATGTIFGSALSAMSQDHGQSLGGVFGIGPGYSSSSGNGLPMLSEDHTPVNGITIDFSPAAPVAAPQPSSSEPPSTSRDRYTNGGYGLNSPYTMDEHPPNPPRTSEWTLPRSGPSTAASPISRPFDYPSAGPTPFHPYNPSPPTGLLPDDRNSAGQASSSSRPQPHPATRQDIPQIDSVVAWHDVCFFISLHMRHQHGLMPLVHKPTFAQDVLQRRDVGDETFRGLLCSIVAYTICQCPINIVTPPYSRQDLEVILRRCQKTSRAIQLRWHMSPSLESLASLQLDTNTALAATQVDLATALISDARRQVYAMGLHTAQPKEGLSCIQLQICRRLFWEIYQSDKTNVMNAISAISLNDLEGVPPLPLEIDDDFITTSVATPQPEGTVSYMTGFVVVSRIFQILGQCQIRQKTFANNRGAGPPREELLIWVEDQRMGMRRLLDELPGKLRADWREVGGFERAEESSLGIQRANIHITALCVELTLLDFRVHLDPEEDTRTERESLARKAYATLSSVPIEYLASNGESMRGKVLRIVLDLLSMTGGGATAGSSDNLTSPRNLDGQEVSEGTGREGQAFGKDVWDWWNMYSSVQFFQVIPVNTGVDSLAQSRGASPGR